MTQKVTMPEPAAYLYVHGEQEGVRLHKCSEMGLYAGTIEHNLITTAQAEAYAAAKVREALAWQPIETAPQGELCLFYDANALDVPGCMFTDWVVDGRFYGVRSRKATHWMSLPTHPAK